MDPIFKDRDSQHTSDEPSESVGEPEILVVECSRIQTETNGWISYPVLQQLHVLEHMGTSTLLISLCDHNASGKLDAQLLATLDRDHGAVGGIAIISSSSPIKLVVLDDGDSGTLSLVPPFKRRLFVEMAIVEHRLWELSLDLCKDDGREVLFLDDLSLESLNVEALYPSLDVFRSFI